MDSNAVTIGLPNVTIQLRLRGFSNGQITAAITSVQHHSEPQTLIEKTVACIESHFGYTSKQTGCYIGFWDNNRAMPKMQLAIASRKKGAALAVFLPPDLCSWIEVQAFPYAFPSTPFSALPKFKGFLVSGDRLEEFWGLVEASIIIDASKQEGTICWDN